MDIVEEARKEIEMFDRPSASTSRDLIAETVRLRNALNHIIKITNQSSEQTVRLKWIRGRASAAINDADWKKLKKPKNKYMPSVLNRKSKKVNT